MSGTKQTLKLDNILVGDVWVLGGQSNMEFPLDRIENGQLEIVSANYPNIRILTVPAANGPDHKRGFPRLHEWSGWFGRHYRKGDWDACTPEIARELSAIGYVFARRIHTGLASPHRYHRCVTWRNNRGNLDAGFGAATNRFASGHNPAF